ncbi:hypothetical protein GJ496_003215, partial [Pomphorhynchus laevis]
NQTLNRFREHKSNLLIATSVIEEGFDVPTCNFVIHFFPPQNVASFIQAKGRARAINSTYTVFVEINERERVSNAINEYRVVEKMLENQINTSEAFDGILTNDDINNVDKNILIKIGAVHLNPIDAVHLIYAYCSVLSRGNTSGRPHAIIEERDSEGYQCFLLLPRNCGLKHWIIGDIAKSKKSAKCSAFVNAVRILHEKAELNEYLIPKIIELRNQNTLSTIADDDTYKLMNEYISLAPLIFSDMSSTAYLIRLSIPDDEQSFGMIFFRPVPKKIQLKMNNNKTHFKVLVEYQRSFQIDIDTISLLFEYHVAVYQKRNFKARPLVNYNENVQSSRWFICPLDCNGQIDFNIMRKSVDKTLSDIVPGSLVKRSYGNSSDIYRVINFQTDINVNTKLGDQCSKTFKEYYLKCYDIMLPDDSKFVYATREHTHKNFLIPESKLVKTNSIREYFPVHLLNLTANYLIGDVCKWADVAVATSYSLSRYLACLQLLDKICNTTEPLCDSLCTMPSQLEWNNLMDNDEESIPFCRFNLINTTYSLSIENRYTLLTLLNRATTLSSSCNENLERLEILGDSFLKFALTIYYFCSVSDIENEGYLEELRKQHISNSYLFQQATLTGLSSYLAVQSPVMYNCNEDADGSTIPSFFTLDKPVGCFKMRSKRLADCVESIIGAFLVSEGYESTLHMMQHFFNIPTSINKAASYERPTNNNKALTNLWLQADLSNLECKLNYKFKDKSLLLEAISHPSAFYNSITNCYERFEFVGDALVDFLITRFIYLDCKKYTPGQVSSLRSALVNNCTMAMLSVKHKLYQHVIYVSAALYKDIDRFVEYMEPFVDHVNKWQEILWTCPEPPKVLADIFESIAGAIFFDSGHCLQTCWTVLTPLFGDLLSLYKSNIPRNPIRCVYEKFIGVKFSTSQQIGSEIDKVYKVICTLPDGRIFEGIGTDPARAKRLAALEIWKTASS